MSLQNSSISTQELTRNSPIDENNANNANNANNESKYKEILVDIEYDNKFTIYLGDKDLGKLCSIYRGIDINYFASDPEYAQDVANYYRFVKKDKDLNKIYKCYNTSINGKYRSSTFVFLGTLCSEKKDYKNAIILFQKSIDIDNNASAHNNLGNYYYYEKYIKLLDELECNIYAPKTKSNNITIESIMQKIDQIDTNNTGDINNISDTSNDTSNDILSKDVKELEIIEKNKKCNNYFILAKEHYTISATNGNKYAMKNLALLYSNNPERVNSIYCENGMFMAIKWYIKAFYNRCPNVNKSMEYVFKVNIAYLRRNIHEYYILGSTDEGLKEVKFMCDYYHKNSKNECDELFEIMTIVHIANETDVDLICRLIVSLIDNNFYCLHDAIKNHIEKSVKIRFLASVIEYKYADDKLLKYKKSQISTPNNITEEQLSEQVKKCLTVIIECLEHLTDEHIELIWCAFINTFKPINIYIMFCKNPELMKNSVIKKYIDKYCVKEKSFIGNRIKNCSIISECPVCLEKDKQCIILDCFAHYVCLDCFPEIINMRKCPCCKVIQRAEFLSELTNSNNNFIYMGSNNSYNSDNYNNSDYE